MIKTYFAFIKDFVFFEKRNFIIVCIITFFKSLFVMTIPLLAKILLDDVFPDGNTGLFVKVMLIMVIGYIFISVLNVLNDYILAIIVEKICYKIRCQINQKISNLKFSYFSSHSLGDVISRYSNEVNVIKDSCGYMLISALSNLVTFIMACTMILLIEWRVIFISCIFLTLYFVNNALWSNKVKVLADRSMKCNESSLKQISENYHNVIVTKLCLAHNYVNEKFKRVYKKQFRNQLKLELTYSMSINISSVIINLLVVAIWVYSGLGIFNKTMTIGSMTALISYQGMLLSPLNFFAQFNNSFQSTLAAIDRLNDFMIQEEEASKSVNDKTSIEDIKRIEFRDVYFGYSADSTILEKINLTVKKGSITGIVGTSGSGKSTIAKLIVKMYNPISGEIFIDNERFSKLSCTKVREKITMISQDTVFFNDTIINNISFGNEIDIHFLENIAKKIDVFDEIVQKKEKWNTIISSGSNNISGGQKKRLDVLRGIMLNTSVIIFDESTSSIDAKRRAMLYDLLKSLKKNLIIIVITHNLEECINFDKLYAVNEKGIVEVDNIDELSAYNSITKE